jgi:hypothetical protein
VQDSKNGGELLLLDEVHTIRKMAEESAANVAFESRELPRTIINTLEHQVEFVEELKTQAGPLVFVPNGSCLNVEIRL